MQITVYRNQEGLSEGSSQLSVNVLYREIHIFNYIYDLINLLRL